jgi:hypothetical protein
MAQLLFKRFMPAFLVERGKPEAVDRDRSSTEQKV